MIYKLTMDYFFLFVGGMEWIWIILIASVLLVGTDKLPELARSLGKAMGEFQKDKRELENEINSSYKGFKTEPVSKSLTKLELQKSASALGIDVSTKTEDEIRAAMKRKLTS